MRIGKVTLVVAYLVFAIVLGCQSPKVEFIELNIFQTTSFNDVANKVEELNRQYNASEILIVLDIDNTILTSSSDLGGDIWYQWQRGKLPIKPTTEQKVPCLFEDAIGLLYELNPMEITEAAVPGLINTWQEQGISLFALTSRAPKYRAPTERELKRNGIDLTRTALRAKGEDLPVYRTFLEREMSYMRGVMMTTGMDKGEMLQYILAKTQRNYKAIVFVDDSEKNIHNMEQAFKEVSMDMHIFHYLKIEEDRKLINGGPILTQVQADSMHAQWLRIREVLLEVFPARNMQDKCLGE